MTIITEIAQTLRTTEKGARIRAVRMKLTPACGRCGGSGRYSWNAMDGSRCYGCDGTGCDPLTDKNAEATLEAAEAAAADGTLDTYIRANDARNFAKREIARVFTAWKASAAAQGNPSHTLRDPELTARQLACRQANARIAAAHGVIQKVQYDTTDAGRIALAEALRAFYAVIEDTDRELAASAA